MVDVNAINAPSIITAQEEIGRQLVSVGATILTRACLSEQDLRDALVAFDNSLLLCPTLKGQLVGACDDDDHINLVI